MAAISYVDFDIQIERTEDGYRVEIDAPHGQRASASFELPFSNDQIENFVLKAGRVGRSVRRVDSPEVAAAKAFGDKLFSAVFAGELRAVLRSSLDEARDDGHGVRVRLRLTEVPELADLPWEYLYNSALDRFLSLSVDTPVVRYLDLPERVQPLSVEGPVSILVIISSPSDYPVLDVEREWAKLHDALDDLVARGLVKIERLPQATLEALRSQLRGSDYHILHFIGHGGFDTATQDGVLVFEDEDRRSRVVPGSDLGVMLHDHRSMRLAVLNACEGARASRNDPFAGVAQSLVRQGLAAVAAMQFEISDQAAVAFAKEFYSAVADDYPVDAAVAEARKAIYAANSALEWGTPVLYMRAPDGRIFNRPAGARPAPPEAVPTPVPTPIPLVEPVRAPEPVPVPSPGPRPGPVRPIWKRWPAVAAFAAVLAAGGALAVRMLPGPPEILVFRAEPDVVDAGSAVTVRWEVRGADRVRISPVPSGQQLNSKAGTATVITAQRGDLEVTLQAFRGSRVTEQVARVRVRQKRPSVRTFTSAVDSRAPGRVSLQWEVSDADSVQITPRVGAVGARGSTAVDAPDPGARVEYRIEARNGDHDPVIQTLVVTALPRAPVIVRFSVEPLVVARGQSTVLVWEVEGAESITVNGGVGALQRANGRRAVTPAASFTYDLTASNPSGSVTRSAAVTVRAILVARTAPPTQVVARSRRPTPRVSAPPTPSRAFVPSPTFRPTPAPTLRAIGAKSFTATPSITIGEPAKVCWEGIQADQARIDPEVGVIPLEEFEGGCRLVRPDSSQTYALSVFGVGGRQIAGRASVEVRPVEPRNLAARIVDFVAERTALRHGESTRLCWVVQSARSVRIEAPTGRSVAPILGREIEKGCREVSPSVTTLYFLTAVGLDGREVRATVNVVVALR